MSLQTQEFNSVNDSSREEGLKVWSCVNCRRRKVRCDRRHPCVPCIRNKFDCVFPISGRIPRRSRDSKILNSRAQKQAELLGRLRRLEAMVGDLGSQVENVAAESQSIHRMESSNSVIDATQSGIDRPSQQLVQSQFSSQNVPAEGGEQPIDPSLTLEVSEGFGELIETDHGDLIVRDRFWTVFCKEVENIFEAAHGPTHFHFDGDPSAPRMSTVRDHRHTGFYNFLLKNTSLAHHQEDLYPLPSQALFLWQIYVDNVDPFVKILHVPTTTKVFRELKGSFHSLGANTLALVLVISLASVVSLEDEEVHTNFNTNKDQLYAQYRLAAEYALARIDFLTDPDMITLQALAIYISILQHTGETRSGWVLAGVLTRAAVSMKYHHDGQQLANTSPFEIEMRNRLWWQICFIDSRSENGLSEFKLSEGMFDSKTPTHTDDAKLEMEMPTLPVSMTGWTDMTIFLIHCEIWKLSCRLRSVAADGYALHLNKGRLEIFQLFQAKIENAYLQQLIPSQPLHCFVAIMTRLFLAKVELILNKQHPSNVEKSQIFIDLQSDRFFMLSLSIVENTFALQNEISWRGWRWQIQGQQPPWHAIRVVLSRLCVHSQDPIYERAWSSAHMFLNNIPPASQGDARYQQLLVLASSVQRNHHETSSASTANAESTTSLPFSTTHTQEVVGEATSNWASQKPVLDAVNEANQALSDNLSLEMDWQRWSDEANEGEGYLGLWEMNNL